MRPKAISPCAVLMVCFALLAGCGTKIWIPTFDTARDQLMFAREQKANQILSTDRKKRHQQMREIILAFQAVIKRFPDDAEYTPAAYVSMGDAYYTFRRYKDAVKTYRTALKKYPDQDDIQLFALYGLGLSYDRLRNYDKAQFYYKNCIDRFRDDEREQFKKIVHECEVLYGQVRTE